MKITHDRKKEKLWLSQERYVQKVLERFNMSNSKPVCSPLASHFKLSSKQCPSSDEERDEMKKAPYASAVGSLMYAMVCTRPDIAHAVGVVSRFLSNPGKEHWSAVKWILRYLKGTSSFSLCYIDRICCQIWFIQWWLVNVSSWLDPHRLLHQHTHSNFRHFTMELYN